MCEGQGHDAGDEGTRVESTPKVKLEVSDWVAFLTNEKSTGVSNVIGFGAILLSMAVIIFAPDSENSSNTDYSWVRPVGLFILAAAFVFMVIKVLNLLGGRSKIAEDMLNRIMRGDDDIRTEEQIRQEWTRRTDGKTRQEAKPPSD